MVQGTRYQGSSMRATVSRLLALVVVSASLLPSMGVRAQEQTLTVNVAGFTAPDWPQAQTVVTVLDNDGRSVAGLTAAEFSTSLNDSPVPVTAVTRGVDSSLPISVVLALDTSGSMAGGAIEQAKAAAHRFLDGLGPQDSVAIITFSTTVGTALPFTDDRPAAHAAIEGLVAEGTTALFEATAESVRLASNAHNARRAVVLLSDGGIGILSGGVTRQEAIATAETGGVPVFAIGLGDQLDRAYLQELIGKTGGQFAETRSPEGLAQLYQDVGELLRGQYILTLDTSALALDQSAPATLRVNVTAGGQQGSAERDVCAQRLCVALTDLTEGERLEAERTVAAWVVAADPVSSVTFLVDGDVVRELTEPPYKIILDPADLSSGKHTFSVEVATVAGETGLREVTVRTGAAGGGIPTNAIAVAVVLVAAAGGVVLIWQLGRRRRGGEPGPDPAPLPRPPLGFPPGRGTRRLLLEDGPPLPLPASPEGPLGRLVVVSGPLTGQAFPLGSAPVNIGSGQRTAIHLPTQPEEGVEIAAEHARLWMREGQLVVHELRRLTAVGAVGGRWEILAPGDVFSIGPHKFRFELVPEDEIEAAGESATPPEVPNVLRTHPAGSGPSMEPAPSGDAPAPAAEEPEVPNILRPPPDRFGKRSSDGGEPADQAPAQDAPVAGSGPEAESGPVASDADGKRQKSA